MLKHHTFTLAPKVHKKDTPGRPIISSIAIQVKFQNLLSTTYNHTQKLYHTMFKTQ